MRQASVARFWMASIALSAVLATCPFCSYAALPTEQVAPMESRLYVPPAQKKPPQKFARQDLPSARAFLEEPHPLLLRELDVQALRVPNKKGLVPLGTSRTFERDPSEQGSWETLPDGRKTWRVSLRSPGAAGLRVHFAQFAVGAGRVWVYPAGGGTTVIEGPYTGRGMYDDGDFWSATVSSDTVIVEYAPDNTPLDDEKPPFVIKEIAHVWEDPVLGWSQAAGSPEATLQRQAGPSLVTTGQAPVTAAASCHLDYKCYPEWANAGQAVAMIVFRGDDGNVYQCSGALLITRQRSFVPYFLTAHHCVATDSEARSIQAFWFHETCSCRGWPPGPESATRIDGARLQATRPPEEGDFSLVRLSALPDKPVRLAGWAQGN